MNMLQWNIYTHSSKFCIWYKFLALLSWFAISPDSRWQTANQAAAQRQTELETCADRLGSFASAASQLGPWLREKELMMSVLGPLSIDPNMLNTQKQQVQVCDRRITEILPKGTTVINTHTQKWAWEEMHQRKQWWWKWLMCSNDFMIWMNYKYLIDLVVSCFETFAAVSKSMLKIRKYF